VVYFNYDSTSDVLFIRFSKKSKSSRGHQVNGWFCLHYLPQSKQLHGITIIDYKKRVDKGMFPEIYKLPS